MRSYMPHIMTDMIPLVKMPARRTEMVPSKTGARLVKMRDASRHEVKEAPLARCIPSRTDADVLKYQEPAIWQSWGDRYY